MTDHRSRAPRHAADPSTVVEPEQPTLAQRAIESDRGRSWATRIVVPLAVAALALGGVGVSALTTGNASDGLGAAPLNATPAAGSAVRGLDQVSRQAARPTIIPVATPTPSATTPKATPKPTAESAKPAPAAKVAAKKAPAKAAPAKPAPSKAAAKAAPAYPRQLGTLIGTRYLTTALNARSGPGAGYPLVVTLAKGTAVKVTGTVINDYRQVSRNGAPVWVKTTYLTRTKPVVTTSTTTTKAATTTRSSSSSTTTSSGACSSGSGVEAGLVYNAVRVHRVVCNRWPSITGYGGVRGTNDAHGTGNALDIMVSGSLGWEVANYLRANASSLGITEVIFSQKIWTTQRASEGWRSMSDRGSVTANHYDHVHVTVR